MLKNLPGVTKNLLYINVIIFLGAFIILPMLGGPPFQKVVEGLGLFYFDSPLFMPHQLVTHMFMHGGIFHIFINMFMLAMFGSLLERMWGPKRFFIYYFFTGFGALILHQVVQGVHLQQTLGSIAFSPWDLGEVCRDCCSRLSQCSNQIGGSVQEQISKPCSKVPPKEFIHKYCSAHRTYITPTVGASGAVFGLLVAFGYLFPNTELMFLLIPVPIKAKYLIPVLILFELFFGIRGGTNIAHFAHLGGAIFGFLLLKYWQRDRGSFY
ncbi:MAG: rhomboid family intramembrane serine protease [Flavobacteriales bacterium]